VFYFLQNAIYILILTFYVQIKLKFFVKCAIKFKYQFSCLKVKELLQSLLYSLCIYMFPLKHHYISSKIVVYWFINS